MTLSTLGHRIAEAGAELLAEQACAAELRLRRERDILALTDEEVAAIDARLSASALRLERL